ncbi:probable polygalacturonase [Magnolia sinica]|uniref:probable polygalacturonase n=1 Tax=Magnolia sinica TaxID=86752 RepID=UPI00265A6E61|nr:probable polygalacturonase [Magnolia sinica]
MYGKVAFFFSQFLFLFRYKNDCLLLFSFGAVEGEKLMKRLVVALLLLLALSSGIKRNEGESDGHCKYKKGLPSAPRPHSVSILEFGAVGDGKTVNTIAFQNAIFYLKSFANKGGAQLYLPSGRWLTGSFDLTSHLTLFLERDAVILGSQESSHWPLVEPLPSYGRGIEFPGKRYRSLINGNNLKDVVITGDNGTIDGQGAVWWEWSRSHSLNHTRPHLVEFESSNDILISNLTFLNSPFWHIHPVYCSNVQVQNIIVHAPSDSPLTNGIVPDSCSDVCIEDCHISVGHDAIVLKSGWDEYGIAYGRPTSNVHINQVHLRTPLGSALAFGSEMSGGISSVLADHLNIHDSFTGIELKTTKGRGGFIKDIVVSNVKMENVHVAIRFTGHCGTHPDDHFDPSANPVVNNITVKNMTGTNISLAGNLKGIHQAPFTDICLSDISLSITSELSASWVCSDVSGFSESVFPVPCSDLQNSYWNSSSICFSLLYPDSHVESL